MQTSTTTAAPITIQPVTLSGWYEHTDGTIGYYAWTNGRVRGLERRIVVPTWAATKPSRELLLALRDDAREKGEQNMVEFVDCALDGATFAIVGCLVVIDAMKFGGAS